MKTEFKIGDRVTITDIGFNFSTYDEMAIKLGATNYIRYKAPFYGIKGRIINCAMHKNKRYGIVYLVDCDNKQQYLISKPGLTKAFDKDEVKIIMDDVFLQKLKEEKIAINCETEQEAEEFCKFLEDNDYLWGDKVEGTRWWNYEGLTCYGYNWDRYYGSLTYFNDNDYTIIKYKDLIKKEGDKMGREFKEYKIIRPFTLKDIMDKEPCNSNNELWDLCQEFKVRNYSYKYKVETWDTFKSFKTLVKYKSWFIDKGFIEEEIKDAPLKPGMRVNNRETRYEAPFLITDKYYYVNTKSGVALTQTKAKTLSQLRKDYPDADWEIVS